METQPQDGSSSGRENQSKPSTQNETTKNETSGESPSTKDITADTTMETTAVLDKDYCDSPMDTKGSDSEDGLKTGGDKTPKRGDNKLIDELPPLTCDDMVIICDLFSIPFRYGPKAVHLLKTGHWLVKNAHLVREIDTRKTPINEQPMDVKEWFENAFCFHECYRDVQLVVDKLVAIPNRDLLYEIYTYVNDMRGVLALLNSYVKWNGQ